ncbi:MAG: hypothetical protein HQ481_00005 [Alphaproteobacteria bacterium]|nr:hypothetical protein [Alphaproteobacteria bacterium]
MDDLDIFDELDPLAEFWPPRFPPLLTGRQVAAGIDPMPTAIARMRADGDPAEVLYTPDRDRLRLAITLAPEVDRLSALQMGHALMLALGDAIGALAPPEVGVQYRWPTTILVNGGACGRLRLALADGAEDAVPGWMVVGLDLWLTPRGEHEPGDRPEDTALYDEGTGSIPLARLLESTSRHFLSWLHRWDIDGFAPLRDAWSARQEAGGATLDDRGRRVASDAAGQSESLEAAAETIA